jgi:cobalt-zinc-cadmium efflux system membrane fusion protein
MQKAKADYEESKARLQSLTKLLDLMHIDPEKISEGNLFSDIYLYAPVNGHITKVYSNTGKLADENNPVYELMDMNHLRLHLNIYEKDISKISKGQTVKFSLANSSDNTHTAKIDYTGNKITSEKRTVSVYSELKDTDKKFKHGMYVDADILIHSKTRHVLPNEAVVRIDGTPHIFIARSNGYEPFKVKPGKSLETYTEINNYKELLSKEIVIKGAYFLKGEISLQ